MRIADFGLRVGGADAADWARRETAWQTRRRGGGELVRLELRGPPFAILARYNPSFASAAAIAAMNASGVAALRKLARSAGSLRILQSALTTAR